MIGLAREVEKVPTPDAFPQVFVSVCACHFSVPCAWNS
jgi:hypothetical protein